MGWFVVNGRKHPSVAACVIGAAIGITLGSLVVPSTEERIASGMYLITTEAASSPSSTPFTPEAIGDRTRKPTPDRPTTAQPSRDEDTGQPSTDSNSIGTGDTSQGVDEPTQDDEPDDDGEDGPPNDTTADGRAENSPEGSGSPENEPDPEPTDDPNPPDDPGPTDTTESPKPTGTYTPPPRVDPTPSPTPTDPPDRREHCLSLDLSLIELLLCLD